MSNQAALATFYKYHPRVVCGRDELLSSLDCVARHQLTPALTMMCTLFSNLSGCLDRAAPRPILRRIDVLRGIVAAHAVLY